MIELNWLGIAIATLVAMALGAFWYSPIAFGTLWMKSIGKTPETLGSQTLPMIGGVAANLLTAVGVAVLFSLLCVSSLQMALCVGVILGFFIIFPALLSDNLFCGWGSKLLMIQVGYRATVVILMSLVMHYV